MGVPAEVLQHALVNEYRPGTPLGWHRDAPDYERVAGVSLGGWARMRLRPYPAKKAPVLNLDHPACRQRLQRLANRGAADPEVVRERRHRGQPVPILQRPRRDLPLDLLDDPVRDRGSHLAREEGAA